MGIVWRNPVPIWRQLLGLLGIVLPFSAVLTFVLASVGQQMGALLNSYQAAPVCTTQDLSACRYRGTADIRSTWKDKYGLEVDVAFSELSGPAVTGLIDQSNLAEWQSWTQGQQVDAEQWRGSLTEIAGLKTKNNPESWGVYNYEPAAWISGVATVLLAGIFAWWFTLWRRAKRNESIAIATTNLQHPSSTTAVPLTADMTAYLEKDLAMSKNPALVYGFIVGAAAVIPSFFSVVYLVEGRFFSWWTPVMWATFLGMGGLLAWWMLHSIHQEGLDLAGGVFYRITGPFRISAFRNKAGLSVTVIFGSQKLSAGAALSLEDIDSGSGSADYLPVSRELIELRDASGQVLWRRFTQAVPVLAQSAAI